MSIENSSGGSGLARRAIIGGMFLGIPAFGAALAYGAVSGRIDLLTPELPESGDLPPVPGVMFEGAPVSGIARKAFFEGVTLLNVWASWCPACRIEHPVLMKLSKRPDIRIFGLAADDREAHASAYLIEHGNPYRRLSVDNRRIYQRALKHRGIPQTYVFAPNGVFVDKIGGELTTELVNNRLEPAIGRAARLA